MTFALIMLLIASAAMWWLCFYAPKMETPKQMAIVVPQPKKDEKAPWWLEATILGVILLCQLVPLLGALVLLALVMRLFVAVMERWAVAARKKLRNERKLYEEQAR